MLPPELFPAIAYALFESGARTTLLELLCTNHQIHVLCLPILYSSLEISDSNGFDVDRLDAFSADELKTGKFSLVKSLELEVSKTWPAFWMYMSRSLSLV